MVQEDGSELGGVNRNNQYVQHHVFHNSYHNVGVDSKLIYVGSKSRILYLHALKLRLSLAAAKFELLYDIRYLFKPVSIKMRCS